MSQLYDVTVQDHTGANVSMSQFKGQVLLIVNTASKCGFTPQYEGLQALQERYGDQGFVVLGFPCNQFANQEPDSNEDIQSFCQTNYHVTFPVFAKIDVNGTNAHPLYSFLKDEAGGILGSKAIKWNFTKFLVGKDGTVLHRYAPSTDPTDIASDIEMALTSP